VRCEEARHRLRRGPDDEAEAHLEACPTCFAELERDDVLVLALRQSKPVPVAPPQALAPAVIRRWRLRRRLPWAVAAAMLVAASVASAALIWVLAPAFDGAVWIGQASMEGALQPFGSGLLALVDLLRSRLVDDPVWLTGLIVVGAGAAAACAVLYRGAVPASARVRS
jgi:hypothetical protein